MEDGGFAALELVILTPVVLVMLLVVVGFGRVSHARSLVDQAAAAAARAASLASDPGAAANAARSEAAADLDQVGISCTHFVTDADVSAFRPGGQVTVTITCTASLAGLAITGLPGHTTLTGSATAPVDAYRTLTGTHP